MNLRNPVHPFVQNALILLSSGIVAAALCSKVYGATLPLEEPSAPAPVVAQATIIPAAQATPAASDAEAAAQLRAMLIGRPVLLGTPTPVAEPRR